MKKPLTLKRRISSPANSECDSARLSVLDWTNWSEDRSFDSFYLHVRRINLEDGMEETWHRVYPKPIAGYTCKQLGVYDGTPFWHYHVTKTK